MGLDRYITMDEFLGGMGTLDTMEDELVGNANTIVPKANELLDRFGEYRGCNSGYRSMAHHLEIYAAKNKTRKAQGLPELKVPMSSRHLICAAIDLEDTDGKLKKWAKENVDVLEELGLYCEALESTPTWLHIQFIAPKSGNRFFVP